MAPSLPDASMDGHFFIKSLKQKREYLQKKLDRIAKYKTMKAEDLMADQVVLVSQEEEIN